MNYDKIVYPSTQLYSTLPEWITEQYPRFVQFARRSLETNQRMGFGQDILQNLEKYRDFDFYRQPIVETGVLNENLSIDETESLTLVDGFGFPEENGVIYLPGHNVNKCGEKKTGEVILYRYREGNVFYELQRGASATIDLGTFVKDNTYVYTDAQAHYKGDTVNNLSVLFLSSMLDTIHDTFAVGIDSDWIAEPINHGTLLERFRDFFQAKGTKLGIQALFKFIFAETDVDVHYPGDRMIKASDSTWTETFIMRSVPLAELLVTPIHNYVLPDRLINRELQVKSYNDLLDDTTKDRVIGRAICDYVSSYQFNDTTQYEFYIQKNNVSGNFPANPFTKLTRTLQDFGSKDDGVDVTTVTVETTLGFPDSGMIFIGTEGIFYESKTFNQFLNCKRGFVNVEYAHAEGETVYGPYFIEGTLDVEDEYGRTDHLVSRSWPLGLVSNVDVVDPGILHTTEDEVFINGPGRIDPREPAISSFSENYNDDLIDQATIMPYMRDHRDRTAGVSGVYFDSEFVFVTSTNFGYHEIGEFSIDYTVGPDMQAPNALHVIPRRESIKSNVKYVDENGKKEYFFHDKGFREIGVFTNGVPAFSNVSNIRIVQGIITKYEIVNTGSGYITPTLLVNDEKVDETITLDSTGVGRIVDITTTSQINYENVPPLPTVEVTGGKDAEIQLEFDRFGRCINATIVNPGKYYYDLPSVTMVDASNIGKGGHLTCTVEGGEITSVTIENPGLDYKTATTTCVVTPVGSNAEIVPTIQYYQFNRPEEVNNNPYWRFDQGNGFLWEKDNYVKQWYGYVMYPPLLGEFYSVPAYINTEDQNRITTVQLGEYIIATPKGTGAVHSPLMGYAYDGNPIYGGNLYANGVDDSDGYRKMFSGYVLAADRTQIIASGGDSVGTLPPSVDEYPMGSFVEDYVYDVGAVARKVRINTEAYDKLKTEAEEYILASIGLDETWVLNENNAVKCNTPEYPAELYPDGVWVYVATEVVGEPTFPYIIGKTFEDRPISQNAEQNTEVSEQQGFIIYNPESKYRERAIVFDVDKVERYRNPYLTPTKDAVELEVAHTSDGSVSGIEVVDGKPASSRIGDYIAFDNTDTGGAGALGQVSHLVGENVVSGEGTDITTVVISHYQRLSLRNNLNVDEDNNAIPFVFVKSSLINTTSNAEAVVIDFDPYNQVLDVFTFSKNLIQPGDSFKDNKGAMVTLESLSDPDVSDDGLFINHGGGMLSVDDQVDLFYNNNSRTADRQLYFADVIPDSSDLQPGNLWWSQQNGRLYIYFDDGDTRQWVCTQPIGMRPLAGASDTGIGVDSDTGLIDGSPQADLTVTISGKAPSARPDGTPNVPGDLWWSSQTGIMYIFLNEWVCTDPNATVSDEYASDTSNILIAGIEVPPFEYSCKQNVIISYKAPQTSINEEPLEVGYLWWSPMTGKMYIWYLDVDGSYQWVMTNPVGMLSTPYSLDYIPDGDGGIINPPVTPLPIPPSGGGGSDLGGIVLQKGQSLMWFEHLKDFAPGDKIKFTGGAPGSGLDEVCVIDRILETHSPAAAVVDRGTVTIEIPDGTNVVNVTKSLYTVTTDRPHLLNAGDKFILEGSAYDEVNQEHTVVYGGVIKTATGVTQVADGKVTSVTVTDPGRGYTENFYVTFYDGGGTGGYAYVEVDLNTTSVSRVIVLDGGRGYTESPEIYWGTFLSDQEFQTYMKKTYSKETGISYITSSENVQNSIARAKVIAPGYGYSKMPSILGVYHSEIAYGKYVVNLAGTSISDVEVVNGGGRYEYPKAFFYDIQGSGSGASAKVNVVDGTIESIEMVSGGNGYVEPTILIIETRGKFIGLTDDIGKIESMKIINPGRAVSPDRSLKPEIMITTRLIIRNQLYVADSIIAFDGYTDYTLFGLDGYTGASVLSTGKDVTGWSEIREGDYVYQGTSDGTTKQVVAEVVDYDDRRQILTVRHVMGNLKQDEPLYTETGITAYVLREGQADCRVVVNGISSPAGRFIDDKSMISSSWAHLQDSYYYQKFSYSIESPLQQHVFDEFVQEIIHPTGFIMFSDLQVRSVMSTEIMPLEAIISGPVIPILSPDNYNVKYTAIGQGEPTTERPNPALAPDTGTVELSDK